MSAGIQLRFGADAITDPVGFDAMLQRLTDDRVPSRLFAADATLWGPEAEAEAGVRLGWVDPFAGADALLSEIAALREWAAATGLQRIVLCGMGGSSLGAEVICRRDWSLITVLDSTHPARVRRALSGDLARTLIVVGSKSGTTVETRSHLAAFEAAFETAGLDPAAHAVIVTDPGSALQRYAMDRGYRIVLADPNVGGRYSALTAFGLVPAALAGADPRELLAEAYEARTALAVDAVSNPALRLATALALGLPDRYIAATVEPLVSGAPLAQWIEQLVAESTGKAGRGLLPIALPSDSPEARGRLSPQSLRIDVGPDAVPAEPPAHTINVAAPLGAQLLLWEAATAVLGRLIGVNPFDQPDVESAKVAARAVLAATGSGDRPAAVEPKLSPESLIAEVRAALPPNGYLVLQAYLDDEDTAALAALRDALAERLGVPVALGFGPRYLHSTGQFHKGGPALGVFLQLLDAAEPDLPIPGDAAGFGALVHAQARGDREVLRGHGRPVFVLDAAEVPALTAELTR